MKQTSAIKKTLGIILCTSLFLTGCGKEKEVKVQQTPDTIQEVTTIEANAKNGTNFVYDDAEMEELAFVDESSNRGSLAKGGEEEIINLAENENSQLDQECSLSWENQDKEAFVPLKFGFDSDRLVEGQKQALNENIEKAKQAAERGDKIALNAFACQIGDQTYNLALSQNRADAMKKVYVQAGVPEDKLIAVGRGQTNPIVFSNATDRLQRIKDLEANRRLEMEIISQDNA